MSINHKVLLLLSICTFYVSSQIIQSDQDDDKTTIERPYCFRFTWLGPKYNEESQFKNATCNDVVKGDKSVPCAHPLVVTSWVAMQHILIAKILTKIQDNVH